MKRHDTADLVGPTVRPEIRPLVGQLIGPVAELEGEAHKEKTPGQETPCYRLEKLLSREVGKRTFLATDVRSNAQVSIKLLLYCPDPQEKEIEAAQTQQPENSLRPYELSAMLPYLDSFEVETTLGKGLALVKPYAHRASGRQSISRQPPAPKASACRPQPSPGQHIIATPTSQQASITPRAAYADFRIKTSADRLSIQCLESRICAGIVADNAEASIEVWLLAILGTVVFVGGTVVVTSSIVLSIIIAALLPVLFKQLITLRHDPRTIHGSSHRSSHRAAAQKQATIRLSREPKGRTHLSLMTALMPRSGRTDSTSSPIESRLHYSRLSVQAVTIAPAFFFDGWKLSGAKLTFTFYNHDAPSSRLCIIGTYREIRWIHQHLLQWARLNRPQQ